jgi:DNA end-binding protein Ku
VLDLIERKAAGHTEVVAPPVVMEEDKVVDLMAALEASVQSAKAARQRHPAGAEDDAKADKPAPAKKAAAKKARKSA